MGRGNLSTQATNDRKWGITGPIKGICMSKVQRKINQLRKMIKPINSEKIIAPYMPSPTGHGFLGTLMYDDVEDKVQCHECGEWKEALGSHLRMHKMSAREYKEKFELNYTTPLTTLNVSRKHSVRAEFFRKLHNEKLSPEEIHNLAVAQGKKAALVKRERRIRNRLTVEMMNKYGTCPKQIEERFTQICDELGRAPSWDELKEKDEALLTVLYRRFKGYSNALQYFGYGPKRRVTFKEYGEEEIHLSIQKFVDDYKRLPNPKDTKLGFLPDYETVRRYFQGDWKKARQFAFEYLQEKYPEEASIYDSNLRRRRVIPGPSVRNTD